MLLKAFYAFLPLLLQFVHQVYVFELLEPNKGFSVHPKNNKITAPIPITFPKYFIIYSFLFIVYNYFHFLTPIFFIKNHGKYSDCHHCLKINIHLSTIFKYYYCYRHKEPENSKYTRKFSCVCIRFRYH